MMRLGRFYVNNQSFYGIVQGERVRKVQGEIGADFELTTEYFNLKDLKFLPPCSPSKIICVGLNYADHARELKLPIPKEPVIFLKPPTTLIGDGEEIIYPPQTFQLEYEAELAVIIGKEGKDIPIEKASDYIFGFTCANDVTARDLQKLDGQWTRAKSFDTFCPLGPYIVTEICPNNLNIRSFLNGELRQSSNTQELIFPINYLVHYISAVMTLYSGDVILTGTPAGVGSMTVGDQISIEIEGIGRITNTIGKKTG